MRLISVFVVVFSCTLQAAAQEDAPAKPPPNVVLIIIDTLRADLLGCYGAPEGASPELDAFADQGVLFETAVAQCSWTRPSVGSMLTSRYPRSLGLYKERNEILNDSHETLAEILNGHGYTTLGVTANPVINSVFNMHQGFDAYVDSDIIFSWMKPYVGEHESSLRRFKKLPSANDVFDRTVHLLDEFPSGPYFIQLNLMEIHEAWRRPNTLTRRPYRKLFRGEDHRRYLQALRQVSHDIQDFVRRLRMRPGFEDTLFIFLSDHGQGMDSHPHVPYSSFHGRIIYESQVMVPLILYHPESPLEARRIQTPVRLLDLMPTLLDYLHLHVPDDLDGVSLLPLLHGQTTAPNLPDEFIVETFYRKYRKIGLFAPPWKYIENRGDHDTLEPVELQPWGIHEDGPRTDRAAEFPKIAAAMRQRLHAWESRYPVMPATPCAVPLSPEEREQLESLGYLGQ